MKDDISGKKRRRRSCYDRLRMRMIEGRRAMRSYAAQSAALQLLALFAIVFGRVPKFVPERHPVPYTPPPISPRQAQRLELARRLNIAPRYVDTVLAKSMVPYVVLFDDIRRGGVARRDALAELRKRMPEASRDWLDHIQRCSLWAELLKCHVPRGIDEDTDTRILKATLAWLEDRGGEGSLPAGASLAYKPSREMEDPNDRRPKPH